MTLSFRRARIVQHGSRDQPAATIVSSDYRASPRRGRTRQTKSGPSATHGDCRKTPVLVSDSWAEGDGPTSRPRTLLKRLKARSTSTTTQNDTVIPPATLRPEGSLDNHTAPVLGDDWPLPADPVHIGYNKTSASARSRTMGREDEGFIAAIEAGKPPTPPVRWLSRSQKRREERADSLQDTVLVKDFAQVHFDSSAKSKRQPTSRSILAVHKSSPHTRSHEQKQAVARQSTTRLLSGPVRPPAAAPPLIDSARNGEPMLLGRNSFDLPIRMRSSASTDSTRSSSTPSVPPGLARHQHHQRQHERVPDFQFKPPVFDMTRDPRHLWLSELSSTSRPAVPWKWCKRWTCCHCNGLTIVEQNLCSNLMCKHTRCGWECRLIKQ